MQLVANGQVLDSKPLRIIGDPAVRLADAERRRYNEIAEDAHELQRRATAAQVAVNALNRQLTDATPRVRDGAIPADVKARFDALVKDFDGVRRKFGVGGAPAAPGGGGGGRGGAPFDPQNVVLRVTNAKAAVTAFWEMPSASVMRQYNDAKSMLPSAVAEANAIIARANGLATALRAHNVTLNVPQAIR